MGTFAKGALALLLVCAACGGDDPPTPPGPLPVNLPPPAFSWPLEVPETHGTILMHGSDFSAQGTGQLHIGDFDLEHGAGQIELDGENASVAAFGEPISFDGWSLYNAIAVQPGRLWILYFYVSGSTVSNIYYETTDGLPSGDELASGTATLGANDSSIAVDLPAFSLPETPFAAIHTTIGGSEIELDGSKPGAVVLEGMTWALIVFNTIDCTDGCGTGGLGWFELHSLLWEPLSHSLVFGVIYLQYSGFVSMEYSLELPSLHQPDTIFTAEWPRKH